MKMRAVCLREPWLYLMLDVEDPKLRKGIENRGRKLTNQLGPILAKSSAVNRGSKKFDHTDSDTAYYADVRKRVLGWGWFPEKLFPDFEQLQFGGIRGAFNFADLLEPHDLRDAQHRWKFPECFGYVVDKSLKLPFRPLKGGGQGIFYTELTPEEELSLRVVGLLPVVT